MSNGESWARAARWVMDAAAAVPGRFWRISTVCSAVAWVMVLAVDLLT